MSAFSRLRLENPLTWDINGGATRFEMKTKQDKRNCVPSILTDYESLCGTETQPVSPIKAYKNIACPFDESGTILKLL